MFDKVNLQVPSEIPSPVGDRTSSENNIHMLGLAAYRHASESAQPEETVSPNVIMDSEMMGVEHTSTTLSKYLIKYRRSKNF